MNHILAILRILMKRDLEKFLESVIETAMDPVESGIWKARYNVIAGSYAKFASLKAFYKLQIAVEDSWLIDIKKQDPKLS